MTWPGVRQPDGVRRATSSMTPSTPTTGVGWIATSPVWLYRLTLPPVTGTPSCWHASARPVTACANCHMTPGSSGDPKLRQSVTASGTAPTVATLRYASASASCAPAYGSSAANLLLQSVETATPSPVCSSTRTTPASSGVARAVLPMTYRSYWSVTQALLARFGEPSSCSSVLP